MKWTGKISRLLPGALDGVEQAIKEQREEGRVSEKITLDNVVRVEPLRQAQRELGIQPQS